MISERLKVASQYLRGFKCLADCGTDHGLLPIYAVERDYVQKAIASDNKHMPLMSAIKNIEDHRLFGKVETLLAEGLSYLELNKDIDVVSILGMGGPLIKEILSNAYLYNIKRLVLQPNSSAEIVRTFLENNKWTIVSEKLVKEHNKYYQVIVAEHGNMVLSPIEREFGPMIIKHHKNLLKERIMVMISQLKSATLETTNPLTLEKLSLRIAYLEEAIL